MDIRNRVMTSQPFDKTSVVLQKRIVCDQNWAYVEIQDGGLGPSLFFTLVSLIIVIKRTEYHKPTITQPNLTS